MPRRSPFTRRKAARWGAFGVAAINPLEPARAADPDPARLHFDNMEVRPSGLEVVVDGKHVPLTVREFQLLNALVERHDHVVRRVELYQLVWGRKMKAHDRAVDVMVVKIRDKLAAIAPDWEYVHTAYGVGYRFAPTPASELARTEQSRNGQS